MYNSLTGEERIGQLFMVAAYSGGKNYNDAQITDLISKHRIGGLIFMQGGPARQATLTNKYQQMAQVPLLIAMDAEWGLGMRLDSVQSFPKQMMLGATRDTALMYQMGMAIAYQCKRLGVHVDFAPDVDVNNNPANPVINMRSFGEDKTRVARMGIAYMRGLQDNGVIACAKHFPGHGDTDVDSHKDLPTVNKSLQQLDTLELYPFRELIKSGVKSIMVAHLAIPALETEPHVPTTLSASTVTGLLKNKMKFPGIVFTDALNMQGVTKYFGPGEVDLRALMAGNDMLLFSQDVPVAISKIDSAVAAGAIDSNELGGRVKKILAAKYDAGLNKFKPVSTENITEDLNRYVAPLRRQIAAKAITLIRDNDAVLGKIAARNLHVNYIGVNASASLLHDRLYDAQNIMKAKWLPKGSSYNEVTKIVDSMSHYDANVVVLHNLSIYPTNNYGLDAAQLYLLQQVQGRKDVMLVIMGNAYAFRYSCKVSGAIVAYDDDSLTQEAVADVLLGAKKAVGHLPVTPVCDMTADTIKPATPVIPDTAETLAVLPATNELQKVEFAEDGGVKSKQALDKLNRFIQNSIISGAFPGCRILAAKDGKVFYDQSFGYQSYNKLVPVDEQTIYDVASCTKVLATNLAVMRLYEDGKLDLNKTIGDYLPAARGTDKAKLRIEDLLLHQAGLKSWIPFYKETLDEKGNLKSDLYVHDKDKKHSIEVARDLYLRNDYRDTIWKEIYSSQLENKGRFVYSDLDFYFLAAIVEQITKTTIDKYVQDQFYKPLGLKQISYQPLKKWDTTNIAPTEYDIFFRHQQVHGYVHDPGAALFGGVAGHAGIFATAHDVGVIFQMLLNYGTYGKKHYFKKETVEKFIAYNTKLSRRGLGFDKPQADRDDAGPTGNRCSGYTFGHQGFTGTCVWADPATGVLFVFLSNRVYPSADNNLINKLNVRTVAQDYIYESLGIPVNHAREAVKKLQLKK
ncbi:glycoside hydrolase family 3 N-terminal domain-containing protein [Chitinophagaceae bacterium MMS25-I14]